MTATVSFAFKLPDGTTESIQLTASSATPPPAGSFAIGLTSTATATNLNAALNSAVGKLANTSLVAASAIEAGNDFFNTTGTATGSRRQQQGWLAPITGATLLSGAAGTDSLAANFALGDTITVNGTPITFVASGAAGNQLNITDSVQTLLSKINSITGSSTPSTVSGGVDRAAHRQRRQPDRDEFECSRFHGTRLRRHRDRDRAAAPGWQRPVRHGDLAGERDDREYNKLVYGRSRSGARARHRDGAS